MKEENPPLENSDNSPIKNPNEDKIIVSDESHDVKWIPLEDVARYNPEKSIRRMIAKTIEF